MDNEMTSDRLTDEQIAKLQAMLADYARLAADKSETLGGVPTRLYAADDIASQAVAPLLAEVARLRAERAELARVAVEVARLDSSGESLCYCWRERRAGHNDSCWVLSAHMIAHATPSGEMDG